MVWSKIDTLQTSYNYEQIYSGYNSSTSRAWHIQQMQWIIGLLQDECGFTVNTHPSYSDSSSRYVRVLTTPQFTDIRTGALTSWYWIFYFSTSYFTSTGYDPWRFDIYEGGYAGNPPTAPGTNNNYRSQANYAADGGDRYATGVLTAWKSSLNPSALMILTGNPYLVFYWPGPTEAYRPYAADPEPWKYQGAMLPWGQFAACQCWQPGR